MHCKPFGRFDHATPEIVRDQAANASLVMLVLQGLPKIVNRRQLLSQTVLTWRSAF